jgi:NADH-quinone oxidoreductase subunit L
MVNNSLETVYEYGHALEEHHLSVAVEATLMIVSGLVAVGGIAVAYVFYLANPAIPGQLARRMRALFNLLANKYWIDEIYDVVFVQTGLKLANAMARGVDNLLIDNVLIDGSARAIGRLGRSVARLQDGYVAHYALATFIGVLIIVSYFFLR